MSRIFDPENKFWSFIGKIADVTCMSVLWAATSLPLVTLGASTTAFYAYTMRQVRLYAADPDATEFEPDESDGGTADSGDSRPEDSGSDPEKPDDSKADNSSGSPDTGAALPCAALLTALGALAAVFGSKKRRS